MGNAPTPLRREIRAYDYNKVKALLDNAGERAADLINDDFSQDCILDACTKSQGNALYYAVVHKRGDIVPLLLEKGADVHATGELGETCLHFAARHNQVDTAKILVQYGADVNATDDQGHYPIHSTAHSIFDSTEMIDYLLKELGKPEDVNARDFHGRTPLHEAAFGGNIFVVKSLLERGAEVNAVSKAGNTPLHGVKGHGKVWDELVKHGADVNAKNNEGETPLSLNPMPHEEN